MPRPGCVARCMKDRRKTEFERIWTFCREFWPGWGLHFALSYRPTPPQATFPACRGFRTIPMGNPDLEEVLS